MLQDWSPVSRERLLYDSHPRRKRKPPSFFLPCRVSRARAEPQNDESERELLHASLTATSRASPTSNRPTQMWPRAPVADRAHDGVITRTP
jgi:hypothetical protein